MPLYVFACSTCGLNFEKDLRISVDQSNIRCPSGHQKVHRVYSAPPVMFKGSGFYVTDHRSSTSTNMGKS
jgi:putative FmdB family regulatory protein